MDISFLNTIGEKLSEVGKFLFETIPGVAILIGAFLLITLLIAVVLEVRTKNKFKNHPIEEDEDEASQDEEDSND